MKDIMKEVKFSMADCTMMLLVQQAMDKAYEKIKTKHGLLLRLNAISIFYELAVLQLESCLSFVHQETDKLESNHEEVVGDLREIKERLHHRLLETELAILEKDRELLERSENEASLRNVLERKETELVHLQDLERSRSQSKIEDFIKEEEDPFLELKSSVDQQVMNLRQKLETEYDGNKSGDDPSGVDIDVLKETMDLAFNKMHHAIFLSELGPIEQSWRWSIERDSMALLIKGFMNGLEEKTKKVMRVVREYESGFKEKICSIRREVECLESQRSSPRSCVATTSSSSLDLCEVVLVHDDDGEEEEEEEEEDSSNYPVSKLIKSHESIIRRKSEELAPPKIEPCKRQKSFTSKRAIDDIITSLDSLMSLNTKLFEHLFSDDDDGDSRCDHDKEVIMDDGLDDVWMKMQRQRLDNAVEEKEDAEMRLMILNDVYLTLLKSLLTDERLNNRKARESEKMEYVFKCRMHLDREKDLEILREDEGFRQEVDWIIVKEMLREVSDTMETNEKIVANNIRMIVEEGNRAFLEMSLGFDDFDVKIQEKLKCVAFRLLELETKIHSTMGFVTELRQKELVYRNNKRMIVANDNRVIVEEGNRAFLEMSLGFDDFDVKIQEKLKTVTFRLQKLEIKIHSTMAFVTKLRQKELVYRTAFVLRSQNLIKAETEVDLLGNQVDSLVKLLQKILWTFNQHPLLLCNNSDILEISKIIKKELSYEDS